MRRLSIGIVLCALWATQFPSIAADAGDPADGIKEALHELTVGVEGPLAAVYRDINGEFRSASRGGLRKSIDLRRAIKNLSSEADKLLGLLDQQDGLAVLDNIAGGVQSIEVLLSQGIQKADATLDLLSNPIELPQASLVRDLSDRLQRLLGDVQSLREEVAIARATLTDPSDDLPSALSVALSLASRIDIAALDSDASGVQAGLTAAIEELDGIPGLDQASALLSEAGTLIAGTRPELATLEGAIHDFSVWANSGQGDGTRHGLVINLSEGQDRLSSQITGVSGDAAVLVFLSEVHTAGLESAIEVARASDLIGGRWRGSTTLRPSGDILDRYLKPVFNLLDTLTDIQVLGDEVLPDLQTVDDQVLEATVGGLRAMPAQASPALSAAVNLFNTSQDATVSAEGQILTAIGNVEDTVESVAPLLPPAGDSDCEREVITDPAGTVYHYEGTPGPDNCVGTSHTDIFYVYDGSDSVTGWGNGDLVHLGRGVDTSHGNAGPDSFWGGKGNDKMHGSDGDDTFYDKETSGWETNECKDADQFEMTEICGDVDYAYGEGGRDNVEIKDGDVRDTYIGGPGNDTDEVHNKDYDRWWFCRSPTSCEYYKDHIDHGG